MAKGKPKIKQTPEIVLTSPASDKNGDTIRVLTDNVDHTIGSDTHRSITELDLSNSPQPAAVVEPGLCTTLLPEVLMRYKDHLCIPPNVCRTSHCTAHVVYNKPISAPFRLTIHELHGIKQADGQTVEYQVFSSLYDVSYKQFFGRQWQGPTVIAKLSSDKVRLQYNQNIYFHTSINDVNIMVVMEIVAVATDSHGKKYKTSCGWGIFRPIKNITDVTDASKTSSQAVAQKLELYHGSPRALYLLDDPIEGNQYLKVTGSSLSYTLRPHRALLKILHLLPENTMVGENDVIPGLTEGQTNPLTQGTDALKKPRLLQSVPCQIDRFAITLNPTVDKFEEELCQYVNEDRMTRDNKVADGSSVSILERRLQVGVHNGWCFVEKPQTVHLEIDSAVVGSQRKIGMSPSMRRTGRFTGAHQSPSTASLSSAGGTALVVRNSITVNELVEDPLFAVIFTLEYIIGEPISSEERKMAHSLMRAQSRTVTIRWAAWNPFMQYSGPEVQIGLIGGTETNPDDVFIYRVPPTDMQDVQAAKAAPGSLSLAWVDLRQSGDRLVLPGHMHGMQSPRSSEEAMLDNSFGKPPLPGGKVNAQHHMSYMNGFYQQQFPMHLHPSQSMDMFATGQNYGSELLQPISPRVQKEAMIQPQVAMGAYSQLPMQPNPMLQQMYAPPYLQGQVAPGMYGMPHPQMQMMHAPYGGLRESDGIITNPDMTEVLCVPFHAPIQASGPHLTSGHGLSRASYARLYAAGFPPLLDRNNDPPEVVNTNAAIFVNLEREELDPLMCNEIVFQFLAYSKMLNLESTGPPTQTGNVFFTFQFYRYPQITTERLLLAKPQNDLSGDQMSMPFILQRLDKDGTLLKADPGFEVRYYVDPEFLKPGERPLFLHHLSQQVLHVDVWDGDSLLLIGSTALELKYLCRQGRDAVQATFELDVSTTEYEDDSGAISTKLSNRAGAVRTLGETSLVKGRIHLRLANIGHPMSSKDSNKSVSVLSTLKTHVIVSPSVSSNATVSGGSMTTLASMKRTKISKASHIAENNREVASLLFNPKDRAVSLEETNREADTEKKRKLSRMQTIRQMNEGLENTPLTIMGYKKEKTERMRDFQTIDFYRQQTKHENIVNMLSESITTEHTIHPSFGTAEFFEFVLQNPYNVALTITVDCTAPELRVITDTREWQHFKILYGVTSAVEEGMFTKEAQTQNPQIFLRPKETVNIPLKYQTFQADQSVHPQGPVDPFKKQSTRKSAKEASNIMESHVIKVSFSSDEGKPVAVLRLNVDPQPHIIEQTFRFYHPEQTFLKKAIRLPPMHSLPGVPVGGAGISQVFVKSSDKNIICESKSTRPGEPQDVFFKVGCGPSPQTRRFHIAAYTDAYLAKPATIWQVYVHSLQRVDMNCVEGQTSKFSLILRGTQSSRLVRCFSSHPNEMTVSPSESFVLAASTVHELEVAVRPLRHGNKLFYINVVDVEYHQLLRTWLICVNCRESVVSRTFEVTLPVSGGKGSNKRISYTNPYAHKKVFLVRCNRDDLVQFKETRLEIASGETHTIAMRFAPSMRQGNIDILVFINDEEDKNEETFSVKATYTSQSSNVAHQ